MKDSAQRDVQGIVPLGYLLTVYMDRGKYVRRWCGGHFIYYQGQLGYRRDYVAMTTCSSGKGEEVKAVG